MCRFRSKLFKSLNLVLNPNSYRPVVVYDLDSQLLEAEQTRSIRMEDLETISKHHIGKPDAPLEFESRFESGNLRRAMQVCKRSLLSVRKFISANIPTGWKTGV